MLVEMKPAPHTCWKCDAALENLLLPVPRLAKCKACNADLHVCRMCNFYDTTVSNQCREPIAEKVNDKQRSNFCGYYQPFTGTRKSTDTGKQTAQNQLDALFGLNTSSSNSKQMSAEDEAKRKLEELFGIKDGNKSNTGGQA